MALRLAPALATAAMIALISALPSPASAGPIPAFDSAFATASSSVQFEQVQFRRGSGRRTALGVGIAAGVLGALAVGAMARPAPPRPVVVEQEPLYGHPREPVYMRPAPRRVVVEDEPMYGHPREPVYMRPARPAYSDAAAMCAQRYRSYDPASGTYRAFDGSIRSCP